jgi:IS4 transposase
MPVFKGTGCKKAVDRLVREARKYVRIKHVLMDRGFYSVDVFNCLDKLGLKYVACARKSGKMEETIKGRKRTEYEIKNTEQTALVDLVIYRPPEKEDEWVYVTNIRNIPPKTLADQYKKRWGIETGYRSKNKYQANTTSKNYSIRLFYMLLAIALYNFWVLVNLSADFEIIKKLKKGTEYTPSITIHAFKQELIQQLLPNG